jgi:hypothetical protein
MKSGTKSRPQGDELRRSYSAADLKGGVRGKYAKRSSAGTNLIRLDADVSKAFPDEKAVNDALRLLIKAATRGLKNRLA